LFRRFPYWFWLITSLLLWSIATWRYYTGSSAMHPAQMAKAMSKDLQKREEAFNKLINDTTLLKKIVTPGQLSEKDVLELEETPFFFYVYNGLNLHFWNNNIVIIDSAIKYEGDNGLLILDRGAFVSKTLQLQGTLKPNVVAVLFPIAYYYPFENKYISSSMAAGKNIPTNTILSEKKQKGSYAIKSKDGKVAFYAQFGSDGSDTWAPGYLMLILLIVATLTTVVWIQLSVRYLMRKKRNRTFLLVMLIIIIALRGSLYLFGLPFGLRNIPFFGPLLYASNAFLSSLGDVVLNVLCLVWISLIFIWYTPFKSLCDHIKEHTQKTALVVLFTVVMVGLSYFFTHQVISLVVNSSISFELSHFGTTDIYTIIGLFTIVAIVGLSSLTVYVVNHYLNKLIDNKWFKYLLVTIAAVLFVLLQKDDLKYYVGMTVWLVLFVMLLDRKKLTINKDLLAPNMVFWAIYICGFCTVTIQYFNHAKERQTRKSFAERIITQRDNVTEYAFNSIASNIEHDEVIVDFFKNPLVENRARITEHFDALYLSGQLNRYNAKIYLYNERGEALPDNKDIIPLSVFEKQKETAFPVSPDLLYYKEYAQDGHYYLATVPITDVTTGDRLGHVYIDLALKPSASETVYPELLQPGSLQTNPLWDEYSYAVYINKSLISQTADYPFPVYLRPYPRTAEFAFSEEEGASALWYKPSENRTVKVVYKHTGWIESVTIFSYLFGMVMLLTFFVAVYQFYFARFIDVRNAKGKFRNITLSRRIHFSMLSLVFISFLVIGVVTVTFFNDQYNESNKTKLNSTMQVIEQSVHEYLRQENSLNEDSLQNIEMRNAKFKYFIANLANTQKVDINLFDNLGILEITSQDDIYDKALLARIIRPDAYRQLFIEHKSVYIQDESLGNLKYLSCYVPLRDEYGTAVGYLNVPYFASEKYLKNQISNILVTLINLYAFIFLLSSMLTGFLTRWLTRTFDIIIQQFGRINLQKNERIEWPYEDEIGMLVKEYNKMVKKVEENAAILAQSERESAWREMARQVAHEIKNPLTPMKLNIQYLQQALRNDHPNAKQMADKVSTSLIEQIDNLSYIASEFSNFAKMPEARPEELNLNELLDVALELYINEQTVKVSVSKTDEQIIVFSDKSQLLRVFTNLLENAIQAIPEDKQGKVYVLLTREDHNALISITDNGQGISEEVAERIFQPYFTTKSSGTGLGLAMTKKIIEFWQGQIWFETIEDEGTTFFIRLPIVEVPGQQRG
jgi:two-component system nitrogen regulation sensor histidine kinase NtrY